MRNSIIGIGREIIENVPRLGRGSKTDLLNKLKDAADAAVEDFKEKSVTEIKGNFEDEILKIAVTMTKSEMANFAESLVNITRLKRQVSLEPESVGGPIDVAVISRNDGFIWVKRKHYFEKELNPKFFVRKYDLMARSVSGD